MSSLTFPFFPLNNGYFIAFYFYFSMRSFCNFTVRQYFAKRRHQRPLPERGVWNSMPWNRNPTCGVFEFFTWTWFWKWFRRWWMWVFRLLVFFVCSLSNTSLTEEFKKLTQSISIFLIHCSGYCRAPGCGTIGTRGLLAGNGLDSTQSRMAMGFVISLSLPFQMLFFTFYLHVSV